MTRHFGNRKRTKADKHTALVSLLTMRTRPYSPRDLISIAHAYGSTVEKLKAMLRELGRGALIQEDAWGVS